MSEMTIDEAIVYADHVAQTNSCEECAKEHEQLAKWLRQLVVLRKTTLKDEFDESLKKYNLSNDTTLENLCWAMRELIDKSGIVFRNDKSPTFDA
jgi:hypothetical protein